MYQNEEQVGQAIQSKIADGTVKREDIFYTSKVLCVECVHMCASDFARWQLYNRIIVWWTILTYTPEALEFPGGSLIKTWWFNAMSQDLPLVKEVISHKPSGKEKSYLKY